MTFGADVAVEFGLCGCDWSVAIFAVHVSNVILVSQQPQIKPNSVYAVCDCLATLPQSQTIFNILVVCFFLSPAVNLAWG